VFLPSTVFFSAKKDAVPVRASRSALGKKKPFTRSDGFFNDIEYYNSNNKETATLWFLVFTEE